MQIITQQFLRFSYALYNLVFQMPWKCRNNLSPNTCFFNNITGYQKMLDTFLDNKLIDIQSNSDTVDKYVVQKISKGKRTHWYMYCITQLRVPSINSKTTYLQNSTLPVKIHFPTSGIFAESNMPSNFSIYFLYRMICACVQTML